MSDTPTTGTASTRTATELTDRAPVGSTIASVTRRRTPTRVPASRYTSPEWAERELTRLWPRVWQIACTVDHVAAPGDYFVYDVGPYSVLIVRGDDGDLHAFQNVCRHRGNALCQGAGGGLGELRCNYHRWTWDLQGRLREVPSRKGFGVLRNDDFPLLAVQTGTWGPLVFVNIDRDAGPLDDFLEGVPADIEWAGIDDFHCTYNISVPMACNWKTLIDGFSETYHVQGIHREMLPMVDDVNSPQTLWDHHGKLEQPYGVPSPRLRGGADVQAVWEAFIAVMGTRIGKASVDDAGPAPHVPEGSSLRAVLAAMVRDVGAGQGLDFSSFTDAHLLNLQQYNLFPNATVLVFPDLFQVVKSRPGDTPDTTIMDTFAFARRPRADTSPPTRPLDVTVEPGQADFGLVLNQDVVALQQVQRGLRQPGLTHLTLSSEECRIINLHRNLERYLGVSPTEICGGEPTRT
jgi:phenylpropionate dioxygenase-like ring-hydroxylating dioxygenase large terminal subunit